MKPNYLELGHEVDALIFIVKTVNEASKIGLSLDVQSKINHTLNAMLDRARVLNEQSAALLRQTH